LRCIGKAELLRQVGITLMLWNNAEFDRGWEMLGDEDGKHGLRLLPFMLPILM